MHCILDLVLSKLSPETGGVEDLGFSRVVRATELPQFLNDVLLSNFHGNHWTTRSHIVGHLIEFWQDTLIDLEELASCGLVKVE